MSDKPSIDNYKYNAHQAAERLMQQIRYEQRRSSEPAPTMGQVATVLHALADHTAIMAALKHRPDPTSPWPEATSIGRWLHDVGDDLEYSKSEGGDSEK